LKGKKFQYNKVSFMENLNNSNNQENIVELYLIDRIIAFFTEPKTLFLYIKENGSKVSDWIIPVLLTSFIAILINTYYYNNDYFRTIVIQKQTAKVQEQLKEQVEKKQITKQKADEILEQTIKGMDEWIEKSSNPIVIVFQFVSSFIVMIIFSLIIALYYKLAFQYVGKVMVTFDVIFYLCVVTLWFAIIDIVLAFILSIVSGNLISSLSLGNILGIENFHILFWLNKISIFTILGYIWVAKGISTICVVDSKKSLIHIFIYWIVGSVIMYLLAANIPLFKNFVQ